MLDYLETMKQARSEYIRMAMAEAHGKADCAAFIAKVHRSTFYKWLDLEKANQSPSQIRLA